jgi:hypothetical protein
VSVGIQLALKRQHLQEVLSELMRNAPSLGMHTDLVLYDITSQSGTSSSESRKQAIHTLSDKFLRASDEIIHTSGVLDGTVAI